MPLLKNLQWLPLPLRQSLDSLTWHSRPGCFPLSPPHSLYPSLPSPHPSIHLPTHPSFHASVPLPTYPPIHPSFHPIFIECPSCSRQCARCWGQPSSSILEQDYLTKYYLQILSAPPSKHTPNIHCNGLLLGLPASYSPHPHSSVSSPHTARHTAKPSSAQNPERGKANVPTTAPTGPA